MRLTRHQTEGGSEWAADGKRLVGTTLSDLLSLSAAELGERLCGEGAAEGLLLPPCDPGQEVWASGVTYLRSRVEREAESTVADVYARVYDAERPEIFFKSLGKRVVGPEGQVRIRRDSTWDVPEPELTLVLNARGDIVGYTAGNDVSSRSIEGENPLYLPQAKTYDGSCALGPAILLATEEEMADIPISLEILRGNEIVFRDATSTAAMRRSLSEIAGFLFRELSFPQGVFLMTGTGIVPPHPITLEPDDEVLIQVGELLLRNTVTR